jgi:response regulator RpfG family c-di-GMP phosphodiesterase
VLQIVERLMKLDPNLRYQTPDEAISDLRFALEDLGAPPQAQSASDSVVLASSDLEPPAPPPRPLPTIMCIESRVRQQDLLRDYLSKRGFRVLVLSDVQRGMNRLEKNPPDCIVMMGESIGPSAIEAFQQAVKLSEADPFVCVLVLAERQADWCDKLEQTSAARVVVQPLSLRDLRREIHLAFQRLKKDIRFKKARRADAS